jgi:lipopolysaccharide cholinephosphotransferase
MVQESAPHVEGELSLREVQLASLEILKKIDKVCRAEGIRYWLMYGSLIGAVRHRGFIPWDDDLDIAMPRPDYERFLAYFAAHADELRPLMALRGDGEPRLPFLITRVSDTTYKMVGEYGDEVPELGAFVDVYPFDGAGDDRNEALDLKHRCADLAMKYLQAGDFPSYSKDNGSLKKVLKRMHAAMLGDLRKYGDELHEAAVHNPYETSRYAACLMWPWDGDVLFTHDPLDSLERVGFEDLEALIPGGYDRILTDQYRDYMQLPPEGERVGHHFYAIVRRDAR